MAIDGYKFSKASGGGSGAMDAKDGADLEDLDLALILDPDSDEARLYLLDEDSGETADGNRIVEPLNNAGTKRWKEKRFAQTNSIPVGTIVAWSGGYFANDSNGGFVNVLGNNIAAANSFLNPDGWYVCNGAECNIGGSPIYDGSGRHLPNLTDDRFVMGSDTAGAVGGSNNQNHYHVVDIPAFMSGNTTLTIAHLPPHSHELVLPNFIQDIDDYMVGDITNDQDGSGVHKSDAGHAIKSTGGGAGHGHSVNPPLVHSSGASYLENRPKFLTSLYIQKVI